MTRPPAAWMPPATKDSRRPGDRRTRRREHGCDRPLAEGPRQDAVKQRAAEPPYDIAISRGLPRRDRACGSVSLAVPVNGRGRILARWWMEVTSLDRLTSRPVWHSGQVVQIE